MFSDNLSIPPPPPISQLSNKLINKKSHRHSPKKLQDNVESIDMELSDDDNLDTNNLTIVPIQDKHNKESSFKDIVNTLEPPPPFPDIPEDVDPNSIVDDAGMETQMQKKDWLIRDDITTKNVESNYLPSINDRMWSSTTDRLSQWKDQNYLKDNNNSRGAIRGNTYLRNPMEFRGRIRGNNNWNYRGTGPFRARGSPRPPPYVRGGMIRGRGFSRGNFRGGY